MNENQIAEVLFLINKIESLMLDKGASGQSFSDKVKSFDTFREKVDSSHLGHKFYYDKDLEDYSTKDYYDDYGYSSDSDLENYRAYKNHGKEYWEYKNNLLDGYWHNLKSIGHERNQLMHIDGYKIPNYKQYILSCYEVIEYFEGTRYSPPTVLLKDEPFSSKVFFKFILLRDILDILILSTFMYALVIILVNNLHYEIKVMTSSIPIMLFIYLFFKYPNKFIFRTKKIFRVIKKVFRFIIKIPVKILRREGRQLLSHPIQTLFMWFVFYIVFIIFVPRLIENVTYKALIFIVFIYSFYKYRRIFRVIGRIPKKLLTKFFRDPVKFLLMSFIYSTIFSQVLPTLFDNNKSIDKSKNTCTYYYVSVNKLNIREESNKHSKKVGSFNKNDLVCIEKETTSWSYIQDKGWVFTKYLSEEM